MSILKFKNPDGTWSGVTALQGEPGKDGAIQYTAGDGIKIENDTITAEVTKDYVDDKFEELAEIGFTPEIVELLPTEDIKTNIIYMLPAEKSEDENIYEEWMYINNTWEMVGSTAVDLSNYYTKDEIATSFQQDIAIHPIYYTMPNSNPNWVYIGSELEILFINKINELYKSGKNVFVISIIDNSEPSIRYDCLVNITTVGTTKSIKFTALPNFIYDTNGLVKRRCFGNYSYTGGYTYNSTNDVFVHKATSGTAFALFDYSNDGGAYVQPSNVLTKNNTTAFTPDADYEPATKKYVDDSIVESNIVSIDISGFRQTAFSSGSGTGYASSNASVKAGLEKIARLGARFSIIHLYNSYSSMLCVFSNSYNHSDGGWGAYYTGSYQTNGSDVNGTKCTVTTKYASDGTPQNIQVSFDSTDGFVIKDNVLVKNNTTSYTPSANYHPATKKYVDDAISNSSTDNVKGFYHISLDLGEINTGSDWTENFLPVACLPELGELINKIISDGVKQPIVVIENTSEVVQGRTFLFNIMSINQGETNTTSYHFQGLMDYAQSLNNGKQTTYDVAALLDVNGEMVDGKFEIYEGENTCLLQCSSSSCLTLFNELEFTPIGDYNPATKKYVDDAVANSGASGSNNNIYEIVASQNLGTSVSDFWSANDIVLEAMNKYLKNEIDIPSFRVTGINGNSPVYSRDMYLRIGSISNLTYNYFGSHLAIQEVGFQNALMLHSYSMTFTLRQDSATGDYVLSGSISWDYNRRKVLAEGINASYTPTDDYNPATKKYVDDAVAGVSGGITSESDPIFSASEAARITSTDTANWNNKVDINAVNNAINSTLNGKSYLTSESDPTVPAWAKQPNKPTYTASEVGALPASTVIPTVPTRLSGFTDDLGTSPVHSHSQYLTAHQDISGKQNKVLYGIADPTSDIGTEGDIYVKYV